jgi:hypothetical protein
MRIVVAATVIEKRARRIHSVITDTKQSTEAIAAPST